MRFRSILTIAFALMAFGAKAADIPAEPAPAPVVVEPAFRFEFTPYFWVAHVDGTTTIDSVRRPGASITADFSMSIGDILSNLDGIPFMGAGELRIGRFGLAFDLIYVPLGTDFSTPRDLLFQGGNATLKQTVLQAVGFYRIFEDGVQGIDIGAGARYYNFRIGLDLNPGLLPAESASRTFSWTDPIVAARYRVQFAPQWLLTLYGDIGGFGAGSELSWQLIGTIDYRLTENIDLRIGYRHLQFDRQGDRAELDMSMSGPILGATIRF